MTTQRRTTEDLLTLRAGAYRAGVDRRGATLQSLTWQDRALVLDYDPAAGPSLSQGQVLVPWPNRVDAGRYTFSGTEFRLDITEPERNTAIHGLARTETWEVEHHSSDHVELSYELTGAPGYPFPVRFTVGYRLTETAGLTVRISATNLGDRPAPYGNGTHNYLTVGESVDHATLTLPASHYLPVDERLLPAGPPLPTRDTDYDFQSPRRIGETRFDTAFTGLARDSDGLVWIALHGATGGAALWADTSYRWLQVFSADRPGTGMHRRGLAVEPMTCPPNAFASGEDVLVLEPRQTAESTYGIRRVEPSA